MQDTCKKVPLFTRILIRPGPGCDHGGASISVTEFSGFWAYTPLELVEDRLAAVRTHGLALLCSEIAVVALDDIALANQSDHHFSL